MPSTIADWDPSGSALVTLLAQAARGPRREGVFALWLAVRVAQDLLLEPPFPDRAHRRRVAALEQRLTSLTMAAPLRRASQCAYASSGTTPPIRMSLPAPPTSWSSPLPPSSRLSSKFPVRISAQSVPIILSQLVAPARETLGVEAAEAVALAVRGARTRKPAGASGG